MPYRFWGLLDSCLAAKVIEAIITASIKRFYGIVPVTSTYPVRYLLLAGRRDFVDAPVVPRDEVKVVANVDHSIVGH